MRTCIWPSWCHSHSPSLASVKSRLGLPFWYRLTQVVPEKGPLNGCVCVCNCTASTNILCIDSRYVVAARLRLFIVWRWLTFRRISSASRHRAWHFCDESVGDHRQCPASVCVVTTMTTGHSHVHVLTLACMRAASSHVTVYSASSQWRSQKFSAGGASICSIPFCPFPFSCPTKSAVQSKKRHDISYRLNDWTNYDKQSFGVYRGST